MGTNDVYELVDQQIQDGQVILNVYYYKQLTDGFVDTSGAVNDAGTLIHRFRNLVLGGIAGCQAASLQHTKIKARNLYDDNDADEALISVPGTAQGALADRVPVFNAFAFELQGQGTAVKNGSKRLAGVIEAVQTNGYITDIPTIAQLALAAGFIFRTLTVGADIPTNNVFQPVLVKRVKEGTAPDFTYRLPENPGETVLANLVNVIFRTLLTSQVTRKIGR